MRSVAGFVDPVVVWTVCMKNPSVSTWAVFIESIYEFGNIMQCINVLLHNVSFVLHGGEIKTNIAENVEVNFKKSLLSKK